MKVGQQHDGKRIANVVLLALALFLGLPGCHDRGPSSVQAEPPTQTLEFDWRRTYEADSSAGVFAIVPPGAKLRRSPQPDAPSWTHDGVRSGVVRVLGETDGAVEIELGWQPSDSSMHCVSHSFSDLGLRLFIDRGELEDVTSVGQTIELGPDTGINVAPGVLVDRDAGLLMVHSSFGGDLRVDVDPERLRVDKFYVPARADSVPVALEQEVAGVVRYEDHEFCFWRQSLYASAPGDPPRALVGAECIQVAGVAWLNPEATGCDRSRWRRLLRPSQGRRCVDDPRRDRAQLAGGRPRRSCPW